MPHRFILLLAFSFFCWNARAAGLPPEKLLPKDTVLVVTVPDCAAAWQELSNNPYGKLWQDPALKPFTDKFTGKFSSDLVGPLEQNFGIHLADYRGLWQGQATYAMIPAETPTSPGDLFAPIFILDSKDHAGQLATNLAAIKAKWMAAGKPIKTEKIREVEFTTLVSSSSDISWDKIFPTTNTLEESDDAPRKPVKKVEITFGQSGSLLLVSESPQAIEKVLNRQGGGLVPALEEEPAFQNDFAARLHGAPFYVWANVKALLGVLTKSSLGGNEESPAMKADTLLSASGLSGIAAASFSYRDLAEGSSSELFITVPESKRGGLLKAFAAEAKDATPPSFVPADVVKFWRWRLNLPHSWSEIEATLNSFNPQASTVVNFILQTAGKDKDEKYNLKSELLGNLGDDIIHYEKAPRGNTMAELKSAPSLYLVGSPNPEKLAAALKTGLSFLAQGNGGAKEREFLGRKIYSLAFPSSGSAPSKPFSFCGSGGYVAFSSDADILEEFVRSTDNKGKSLSDTPGLADAAQKAGGMATGLFGYENQNSNARALLEALRQHPITLTDIFGESPLSVNPSAEEQVARLREWADFSLLPSFDVLSKYYYYSVYAGSFSPEGFTVKFFSPTPPKLH
ncbi:MAG TPA: hypothetical protein VFC44_09135 [Candidatus Saccharimonadales bacterium]|nr:hypothetical protein [Candidatus Saccharimonadales bacterium]